MSLTSQIKQKTPRAEALLRCTNPPQEKVPSRKVHHSGKDWSLIGTAFDYLVRMAICKKNGLEFEPSIAEKSAKMRADMEECEQLESDTLSDFSVAKALAQRFIVAGDKFEWATFALKFAKLDYYYRAHYWNSGWNDDPLVSHVTELVELLELWEQKYEIGEEVDLNPVFESSRLWGGADGDIIDDGCMVDWKVVNDPKLGTSDSLKHWAQVTAYALMAIKEGKHISHVAIYYARHGLLVKKKIEDVLHKSVSDAIEDILYEEVVE